MINKAQFLVLGARKTSFESNTYCKVFVLDSSTSDPTVKGGAPLSIEADPSVYDSLVHSGQPEYYDCSYDLQFAGGGKTKMYISDMSPVKNSKAS